MDRLVLNLTGVRGVLYSVEKKIVSTMPEIINSNKIKKIVENITISKPVLDYVEATTWIFDIDLSDVNL